MDVKRMTRPLCLGLALATAGPALGADTSASVKEAPADAHKAHRSTKPGTETAVSRMNDLKDAAKSGASKVDKGVRRTSRDLKDYAHDATK